METGTFTIGTKTAAMLTGKTIRTIINWVESGAIHGKAIPVGHLPHGQIWKIDMASLAEYIPTELTDEFLEHVKAAEKGDAMETTCVATYFYKPGSYPIALDWFALAAKRGDADAMTWLWDSYYKGVGVEPDFAIAVKWLGTAAEHGSLLAITVLEALRKMNETLREQQKDELKVIYEDIAKLLKPSSC